MGIGSKIEWTEATWNPCTGCDKISPGCKNCYAEGMARRLMAMGQPNYKQGFRLATHEHMLNVPLKWKRSKTIFVNSMSDLFHELVPLEFIEKVFSVMRAAHWHVFQVLTKRSDRLMVIDHALEWPQNVWMGVSVEDELHSYRIDHLRECRAKVKFLSLEPLLGPLGELDLKGIDWVIVGGESGARARLIDPYWVREVRDQCVFSSVPFFFKQWGGRNKKKSGRLLDGRVWDEMPPGPLRTRAQQNPPPER